MRTVTGEGLYPISCACFCLTLSSHIPRPFLNVISIQYRSLRYYYNNISGNKWQSKKQAARLLPITINPVHRSGPWTGHGLNDHMTYCSARFIWSGILTPMGLRSTPVASAASIWGILSAVTTMGRSWFSLLNFWNSMISVKIA